MKRRTLLKFLLFFSPATWAMGWKIFFNKEKIKVIKKQTPIDFQWPTQEPFLFCVHHYDNYPAGNQNHGLDAKHFSGRNMGSDFVPKDGFRIYHGSEIPGFPVHPHRGFETITIVRKGYVDHADSLGAAGRYGEGDVQWMTAGSGVQHSEMFPLLHKDKENTLELFQVWLNLPKKNKMVPADFKMLWANEIPQIDEDKVSVSLINGEFNGKKNFNAPEKSWAASPENEVNILLVKMEKDGIFKLRPSKNKTNRSFYLFEGKGIELNGKSIENKNALFIESSEELIVKANDVTEFLILEAAPIGEPVVQHGPFVMNTVGEIKQTMIDYQNTQFGGWNWERHDMIHGPKIERFAKYPNGKIVKPS